MRKTIKRLGAVLLAMAMVVSVLCTGALAADTYSITVKSDTSHTLGLNHTFNAYQIFAGTLTSDSTGTGSDSLKLGINDWGKNIKSGTTDHSTELLTKLQSDDTFKENDKNVFADCTTAVAVANVLAKWTGNNANQNAAKTKQFAKDVADVIKAYASGDACATAAGTTSTPLKSDGSTTATAADEVSQYKISGLSAGYYLVVDVNTSGNETGSTNLNEGDAYSAYILQVAGNVEVVTKSNVPTVEKKIVENQTKKDETTAKVGDVVNFELTGTLPSNYEDYTSYQYEFHDTLSKGLTYNGNVEVYVKNGTDEEVEITGYTVTPAKGTAITTPTDNTPITVKFADLKADTVKALDTSKSVTIDANSKIIVKYSATLNENAVVGEAGNTNTVKLVYSNDPNGTSTGTTKDDKATVYTFQLNVVKVDGATKDETTPTKLQGAKFKLYYEKDGTKYYATVNLSEGDNKNKITGWTTAEADGTELTTDTDGNITVKGLKEGAYYLEETEAPAGYNKLTAPVKVEITKNSTNIHELDSVTADNKSGTVDTNNKAIGMITIANNKGSTLPSTGGMGTKLFYTIGGILMAGAAIVLVVRKRRSDAE